MVEIFKTQEHLRGLANVVLTRALGVPYRWGGQSFNQGFDCSGLAVEVLRSTGIIGATEDYTSQGLYDKFKEYEVTDLDNVLAGCLIFYGDKNDKINHVEIAVDPVHCVGASGGDSTTTTLERAREQQAEVKLRPIQGRRKVIAVVDPFATRKSARELNQ